MMHIFLTIPTLAKSSGGPATVVQHLSEHLVAAGAAVTVLTGAAEPGSAQVLPRDARVQVISVTSSGARNRSPGLPSRIRHALQNGLVSAEKHIIHDFGIWLPANHAMVSVSQELGIPLVISPCGMLASWALQHKRWKKRVAWWLYQKRDLSRAALLVATAPAEQRDIQKLFPAKPVALIPNGVTVPEEFKGNAEMLKAETLKSGIERQRTAVFLGRIYPVKGLRNLIEAWSVVRPSGWQCILAGPDEAGHQAELAALLRRHNLQDSFRFPGMLEDGAKWDLLQQADLFVLPSFTENFGIAVAEALASGVPVVTTKGTPWQELVEHRCGWWVDIGVEPLVAALREATSHSDQERHEMGQRGRQLVAEKYAWPKIAGDLHTVYISVLGAHTKDVL